MVRHGGRVVWLNGPFGVGKSTVAQILRQRLPAARPFDPEDVGLLLRRSLPVPTGDFQDLPAWRQLTVEAAHRIAEHGPGPCDLIVPMTLVDATYRDEIHAGLRTAGLALREFVLVADRGVIAERIEQDVVVHDDVERDAGARRWRLGHLDVTLETCRRLPAPASVLDTSGQEPEQVAARILAQLA